MAQLHDIPVIVREFDDTEVLEVAIIENIQRADLNAVEEAAGYKQLMDRFGHTQEKAGRGPWQEPKPYCEPVAICCRCQWMFRRWLLKVKLSAGHARALITAEESIRTGEALLLKMACRFAATEALGEKAATGRTGGCCTCAKVEKPECGQGCGYAGVGKGPLGYSGDESVDQPQGRERRPGRLF